MCRLRQTVFSLKAALLSVLPADLLSALSILFKHQLFKSCSGRDVKGGQFEYSESFFFKDRPTAPSAITLLVVKYVCIFNIKKPAGCGLI